ncbi:acetylornithine/succinylornithine family transaminase [Proteinivorax tanatarense]|uniref:Acetylornithine/succinylornithine family transaminase n=1 Tax=Proteinivorax tanatarense TaxID=1260629 RepID=A0AAU7VP85_9FIRM
MKSIFEKDNEYILNLYKRNNLHITKAEGCYLYDSNGQSYLDMFSGIAVNSLGQRNKEVIKAIEKQLSKYNHLSNYFVSEPVIDLAQFLVEFSSASKVFFTNSGAEANEAAIKLARKFGRTIDIDKTEIVTFYNSFHGRTTGTMTLTGQEKYKDSFAPVLPQIKHVKFNDIDELKKVVSDRTCAMFLEIVQGEGGVRQLCPKYVQELSELAKKHNFLLIIDEIQTGLCRTGKLFSYQSLDVVPDVITLAKGLGGGLPLGAMLVSEKLDNILQHGDHGSTFGGNPVACAAGTAVLKTITKEGFSQQVTGKGEYIINKLKSLKKRHPKIIKEIRGKGLMIGIDVGEFANVIKERGIKHCLLLNVTSNSVIRILPPLNISYGEIDEFLNKFELILKET